jgi:hypothetical protein
VVSEAVPPIVVLVEAVEQRLTLNRFVDGFDYFLFHFLGQPPTRRIYVHCAAVAVRTEDNYKRFRS